MPEESRQPVILVVDDDPGLLFLIERALRRENWTIATANSGAAALEWLGRNPADLMLLDLKLADTEATELVETLAKTGRSIAFIIITGQGDERVAVDMMKRGALDYIVKDVEFIEFVPTVVRRALDQIARGRRLAQAELRERLQSATTRALAGSAALVEAAQKVLEAVCETMNWELGELWSVGRDGRVLEFVEAWRRRPGGSSEGVAPACRTTLARGVGLPGRVWAEGEPAWIAEITRDTDACCPPAAAGSEFRAGFAFPILVKGEVLGVMAFFSSEIREPETDLAGVFLALGSQVGQFIERKRAEEAMRRSEAMLARTQEIAHVGAYEINLEGDGGHQWSEESLRILGLDPSIKELMPSEYLLRCVHADDRARVREVFEKYRNEGVRFDFECRTVRADGSIRHVHSIVEPVLGANNRVVKFTGTLQDITERNRLEQEILRISEREQSRIGQDLHDGLCQHLAGIEFRLLGLKQQLEPKAKRQAADVAGLAKLVRDAIEQTRSLARGLSPVMIESDGLMNALQELAISTAKSFAITCAFSCPKPVPIHDNAVATHLYRIAQEAVHNAIRHGRAKSVDIRLLTRDDRIILAVKDDGVGIPSKPGNHGGMGLRVMQYRARMISGSLIVQREPGGGTSVVCSLRCEGAREPARTEGQGGNAAAPA